MTTSNSADWLWILWAVNQNKCGHLIGWRYRHTLAMRCTLNENTVFGNIFTLKKGTAISVFNNSPALYGNICSTCVQILGELSVWTPKLCFSEVRKHVVKLKSLYSPTSFLTIKVNFDKIQFEDYCIYRPFFVIKIHIVYFKTVPGLFDTPLRWLSMLRRNENTGKNVFYTKCEIFPKIRLQLANADTILGRRHVFIIIEKRNWNR